MTEPEKYHPRPQAHLVGCLEDATIAAILATSATYEEIQQALKWAGAGPDEPRLDAHGMKPTAELVFDILLSDPTYAEDQKEGARDRPSR